MTTAASRGQETLHSEQRGATRTYTAILSATLLVGGYVIAVQVFPQLPFVYVSPSRHAVIEGMCVIVGLMVCALLLGRFVVRSERRDLLIGLAFLVTAFLDVSHALAYPGMGDWLSSTLDPSSPFRVVTRNLFALLVLAGALFPGEVPERCVRGLVRRSVVGTLLGAAVLTFLMYALRDRLSQALLPTGWTGSGEHAWGRPLAEAC